MVRFKNRHLLVEFLTPSSLLPTLNPIPLAKPTSSDHSTDKLTNSVNPTGRIYENADIKDEGDDDDEYGDGDGEDGEMIPIPSIPFMIPLDNDRRLDLSGDGASFKMYLGMKVGEE